MIQKTLKDWNRVIKLSRKPRRHEFVMVAKVTGVGIIIIGLIGFTIRMIIQIFQGVL
jgi:protein transport protein SEC61 subunit gamma-like protein